MSDVLPIIPLNAAELFRLGIERDIPDDLLYLSAANYAASGLFIDSTMPVVVHNEHPELMREIRKRGGRAVMHADARKPNTRGMHHARLISSDTMPIVTNSASRGVDVAMIKRDIGAQYTCVPGGFMTTPDGRIDKFLEEMAFCIFNKDANTIRILQIEIESICGRGTRRAFSDATAKGIVEKNAYAAWAQIYPATHPEIICETHKIGAAQLPHFGPGVDLKVLIDDARMEYKLPSQLVKHWEMSPGVDSELNIVGVHGFAHVHIDRDEGEKIVAIDAEAYNRPVILDPLGAPSNTQARKLQSSLGPVEHTGFIGFAQKLEAPGFRPTALKLFAGPCGPR